MSKTHFLIPSSQRLRSPMFTRSLCRLLIGRFLDDLSILFGPSFVTLTNPAL